MTQPETKTTTPSSALERLAQWSATLDAQSIPELSLRAARFQILNMAAAVLASSKLNATAAVDKAARAVAGEGGHATVLATGRKTNAADAAAVNAAYSMAQDFDDIIWMGHTCHSAVFAGLAVAEQENSSMSELLAAVVVSNELAGRLGASCFLGPLNGQMLTNIHLVGAAAAAARLLRLDATQTMHALAIALSQPSFALQPAFMAPSSKLLSASTPIRTGIHAAYLAREGLTGHARLLEDRRGFWRRFAFIALPEMLGDLSEFWAIQTLSIKTYPGCHYFQTACSALDEIRRRRGGLDPARIAAIDVATTKLGLEVNRFGSEYGAAEGALTEVNVNFDLRTTLAVLAHAGRLTSREIDDHWLESETAALRQLRSRITVTHEPALTLKTLSSARALPTGRKALSRLTAPNLLKLRSRYGAEYGSTLFSPAEAIGWLRLATTKLITSSPRTEGARDGESAIALYFPNRVTVRFEDGSTETALHDLPVGALCAPGAQDALREKFLREAEGRLPAPKANQAFAAGLRLEDSRLADFVALLVAE